MSSPNVGKKPRNVKFNKGVQNEKSKEKQKKSRRKRTQKNKKQVMEKPISAESQLAPGIAGAVQIKAQICPTGVQTAFCGIISNALALGYPNTYEHPIYWAYLGLLRDFVAILRDNVGNVVSRANYLNEIYSAFTTKTVPFGVGKITYQFVGIDSISETPSLTVNSYTFLMYVPDTQDEIFGNQVFIAPPNPTSNEQVDRALVELLTLLDNKYSHNMFTVKRNPTLGKIYANDTSPFARSAPYHGVGSCTSGAPWASAESEVPFKSRILTTFCEFDDQQQRSSRVLKTTSGDTCYAFSCAMLPYFQMKYYDSAFPPVFKFIDVDEIIVTMYSWYAECVKKYASKSNVVSTAEDNFLKPFTCTLAQFYIAIRQQILRIFGSSQAAAQFLSFDKNNGSFRPFKVGTNCYAQHNDDGMKFPQQLLENLRFLAPTMTVQKGGNYANPRNVRYYIPVLGRYDNNPLINPESSFLDNDGQFTIQSMFLPDIGQDPDIVDGKLGSNWVNLNGAQYRAIVLDWNDRLTSLSEVAGGIGIMGDAGSNHVNLLYLTRYNTFTNSDLTKFNDVQKKKLPIILRKHIDYLQVEQKKEKEKLTRSKSLKEEKTHVSNYPAGTTLFNVLTTYVSSNTPISQTLKQYIKYVILPQICLVTDSFDVSEIQVETQEPYHYTSTELNSTAVTLNNRQMELESNGATMAPGVANPGSTELDKIYNKLLIEAQGGFLGDLLTGAGNLAGVFGL
jgi:hypothetical protein